MSVILGMTGTRNLLSEFQLRWLLAQVRGADELHHGACVGADASAHRAALRCGVQVVAHPPVNQRLAMTMGQLLSVRGGVAILPAKPYHARNRDIVKASAALIALPDGPQRAHSGTWYTVAYATGKCDAHLADRIVPVTICYPDGTVEQRPADEQAWDEFLNRRVAIWHETSHGSDIPLHAFLGLTWDEYTTWTEAKTIPTRLTAGAQP